MLTCTISEAITHIITGIIHTPIIMAIMTVRFIVLLIIQIGMLVFLGMEVIIALGIIITLLITILMLIIIIMVITIITLMVEEIQEDIKIMLQDHLQDTIHVVM